MESVLSESVLTLAEAASLIPSGYGRHVARQTILRYVKNGARRPGGERVVLDAQWIAGRYLTSREAVTRFLSALSQSPTAAKPIRTPSQRKREAARNAAALEKLGVPTTKGKK